MTRIRHWLIALGAVLLLSVDGWATEPRKMLYMVDSEATVRLLGIMWDERTCVTLAQQLNAYHRATPDSGSSFFCKADTDKVKVKT